MSTYKELYDETINEVWNEKVEEISFLFGVDASELFEEHDPIAYRCGFNDWLDGAEARCDCGKEIDTDTLHDSDMDDTVECAICKGTHFECGQCNELRTMDQESETSDLCRYCWNENNDLDAVKDDDHAPVDEAKAEFKADGETIDRITKEP